MMEKETPFKMGMYRSASYYGELCRDKFWGAGWGVLGEGPGGNL